MISFKGKLSLDEFFFARMFKKVRSKTWPIRKPSTPFVNLDNIPTSKKAAPDWFQKISLLGSSRKVNDGQVN